MAPQPKTTGTGAPKRQRPHSLLLWSKMQPTIKLYYIDRDMTLDDTMQKLRMEHDFDATYAPHQAEP
jgi:hypothetical protein